MIFPVGYHILLKLLIKVLCITFQSALLLLTVLSILNRWSLQVYQKTVFPPLLPISKVTSNPNGKFRSAVSKDSRVSSFLRNGFVKSILPSTSCFTILRMREHAKERRFISRQPSLPVSRHKRSRRSRCTCIDALVAYKKGKIRVGRGWKGLGSSTCFLQAAYRARTGALTFSSASYTPFFLVPHLFFSLTSHGVKNQRMYLRSYIRK